MVAERERELWNDRGVVRSSIQNFCYRNISHLFVISLPTIICGLLQKRPTWSASLLQLSHLNRTILPFSLLCLHHFTECFSLSQNNFSLSTFEFREIFAHFRHHSPLLFVQMKMASHLVTFLRRHFGTRSLNHENAEVAYSGNSNGDM